MSKKGDCWDNAVAESFFKTIKYEWLNRFSFENTNQLEIATEEYMQWYNTKRLHSTLGYKTPLENKLNWNKKTIKCVTFYTKFSWRFKRELTTFSSNYF